ncbi:MAG TPA: hypothetical protein VGV60_01560 [Candidatus Polarisedimenticolia bacterium]|jgi:hypothetical protein|nr:hypothetical protein [Candidatus Polarisedimenticolia bacterium]
MDQGKSINMFASQDGGHSKATRWCILSGRLANIGSIEFAASLGLFALLGFTATLLLIVDANWPKALRVGLASAIYLVVLAGGPSIGRRAVTVSQAPSVCWFIVAGGLAGLVSGTVRPDATLRVALVQALGAAFLLGGFHWWAVHAWRRVYARLAA